MKETKKYHGARLVYAIVCALVFTLVAVPITTVSADSSDALNVSPIVVDEKGKARDILKRTITLTNTSGRRLNLYPSVNDVDPHEGEEAFVSAQDSLDRAASLAQWIELSRGVVELDPGEVKSIPFAIRVNLNAVPGTYHARISFSEGSTRSEAEEKAPLGTALINFEIQADIKEVMQLNRFFTDKIFFSGDDVLFNYQFENIGNQDLQPRGQIRIYDRKGKEVAAVDVNQEGEAISPDQMAQLASVWSAAEGFGKFKAFLAVDYGKTQTASIQDTIFFWVFPWKQLLALFVGSLIAVVIAVFYFNRWFENRNAIAMAAGGAMPIPAHMPVQEAPAPVATPPESAAKKERTGGMLTRLSQKMSFKRTQPSEKKEESRHTAAKPTPTKPRLSDQPIGPAHSSRTRQKSYGDTIDLKMFMGGQSQNDVVKEQHMVIDLKKRK